MLYFRNVILESKNSFERMIPGFFRDTDSDCMTSDLRQEEETRTDKNVPSVCK